MCLNPIVAKDHEKVNYTIGKKSCYSGFGVHAVRNVNPNTRIFILSILPMRNDRLVNNTINETNRAIKKACQQQIFVYIDNDSNFLKNGKPDITMYKDAVNLNKTGGNFLGSNIREPLKSHLHTQPQREEEPWKSSASEGFQFQPRGRRVYRQNMMMPPWVPFYPPWFPAPPHPYSQTWK